MCKWLQIHVVIIIQAASWGVSTTWHQSGRVGGIVLDINNSNARCLQRLLLLAPHLQEGGEGGVCVLGRRAMRGRRWFGLEGVSRCLLDETL